MGYNHGKAERKWQIWKEKEEKLMRENGVDEEIIAEIRAYDRREFNSDSRFYVHSNEMAEYIENTAGKEQDIEVITVLDLLNEIESRNLYYELLALDQSVLQILLLKIQGYSTREIAQLTRLSEDAVYQRMHRLKKKLQPFKDQRG